MTKLSELENKQNKCLDLLFHQLHLTKGVDKHKDNDNTSL
jgi:hypothetical protein